VLRGPLAMARAFTALDLLSNGRVIAGIGAGSSARDFAATGIPFAERWARFDEAVRVMRALWARDAPPFRGRFYSTDGIAIAPLPAQRNGPPIWIGSWGSEAGLRRAARLGDGWIASAYNITPEGFAAAWQRLGQQLRSLGKDPEQFPNAIATMAMYVTEDRSAAQRMLEEVVSPLLSRPADDLHRSLLIGSAEECATTLQAYHAAGVKCVLLMPTRDGFRQLDLFRERILPLLEGQSA
jgi:alkanesulfonate monooxygenase SsuD/methylene tetrahydromethanopterin reductase-like flavin-dependent oxidoreductase (luciferase family)